MKRGAGIALIGSIARSLSQWAIVVSVAKFGTSGMVGQYTLTLALTSPIFVFAGLQLRNVLISDKALSNPVRVYWAARIGTSVAAVLAAFVVAAVGGYRGTMLTLVILVSVVTTLDSLADIQYGVWQRAGELRKVGIGLLVNGGVSLAAVTAAMIMTREVVWAAGASAVGSLFALAFVISVRGRANPRASRGDDRAPLAGPVFSIVRSALPLGVVTALVTLQWSIPRFFIERLSGLEDLGVFAAANQLTMALGSAVGAIGMAVNGRLAQAFASGSTHEFRSIVLRLAGVGLAVGLLGAAISAVFGGSVLALVYRRDYASGESVLVWLSLAAGMSYAGSFLGYGMTMTRRFRVQVPLFAMVVAVTGFFCAILVPAYGIRGAAWAAGIGNVVQLAGSAWVLHVALLSRDRDCTPLPSE